MHKHKKIICNSGLFQVQGYRLPAYLQEVSHRASAKPELVKKVIELYADMKTPKEIGTIVGLDCGTVRQVLKDNKIHIRKSWEYPKK